MRATVPWSVNVHSSLQTTHHRFTEMVIDKILVQGAFETQLVFGC